MRSVFLVAAMVVGGVSPAVLVAQTVSHVAPGSRVRVHTEDQGVLVGTIESADRASIVIDDHGSASQTVRLETVQRLVSAPGEPIVRVGARGVTVGVRLAF